MALVKVEEVYLYVSEVAGDAAENIEAVAFMERSGIPFVRMLYNDASQHSSTFEALNSWWRHRNVPELTRFPFVTYVEVHDDIPARQSPVNYLEGIENIKKIVGIYNLQA